MQNSLKTCKIHWNHAKFIENMQNSLKHAKFIENMQNSLRTCKIQENVLQWYNKQVQ